MAGFCNPVPGLWTPKFVKCEANSPKVSRHYRRYSRFRETGCGDRVGSRLPSEGRSCAVEHNSLIWTSRSSTVPTFRPRSSFPKDAQIKSTQRFVAQIVLRD